MEYDHLPVEHQRNTLKNELNNLQAQHWQHSRTYKQAESYDPVVHAKAALALSPDKGERDRLVTDMRNGRRNDMFNALLEMGRLEHAIELRRADLAALPKDQTPTDDESTLNGAQL